VIPKPGNTNWTKALSALTTAVVSYAKPENPKPRYMP
jgi:hypothetical protein